MDVKQLRQLIKKLMKANQTLLLANERLNEEKKQAELASIDVRHELTERVEKLATENENFKELLRDGGETSASVLSKSRIDALMGEVSSQQDTIARLNKSCEELERWKTQKNTENEGVQWRLEQKLQRANNDKVLIISKYEKELDECQHFYSEEQNKLKRLCEERVASVEKQNQNLKSQINELTNFNDIKKSPCEEHVKQLLELKRLHENEVQEMEKNIALTLSQELSTLSCLSEEEKRMLRREKDSEICKLNETCRDLNEIIKECQEQTTKYPEILRENTSLKEELVVEKQRYELREKDLENTSCEKCVGKDKEMNELRSELVGLRKLEEDNIQLASENEKLLEFEKEHLSQLNSDNFEPRTKLDDSEIEKNTSKSKKHLKKLVLDLYSECKEITHRLHNEMLRGKRQEMIIAREMNEKEKILETLSHYKELNNNLVETKQEKNGFAEDNLGLSDITEQLTKSQNRTRLLQTEIDDLRENYSTKLNKELDDMENKWTQRLRRECNAVHSEMAEELRKQREIWKKKENELHNVIKQLQIQVEEIEMERRNIETELYKARRTENGVEYQERLIEFPPDDDMTTNISLGKPEDYISDRDLRRVAYKLKKDQWSRLAILLGFSDPNIREIDQQKVGKEEKAFRVLCQWRGEHVTGNQVTTLASSLEDIRRKDLSQFVMELCSSKKSGKKMNGR